MSISTSSNPSNKGTVNSSATLSNNSSITGASAPLVLRTTLNKEHIERVLKMSVDFPKEVFPLAIHGLALKRQAEMMPQKSLPEIRAEILASKEDAFSSQEEAIFYATAYLQRPEMSNNSRGILQSIEQSRARADSIHALKVNIIKTDPIVARQLAREFKLIQETNTSNPTEEREVMRTAQGENQRFITTHLSPEEQTNAMRRLSMGTSYTISLLDQYSKQFSIQQRQKFIQQKQELIKCHPALARQCATEMELIEQGNFSEANPFTPEKEMEIIQEARIQAQSVTDKLTNQEKETAIKRLEMGSIFRVNIVPTFMQARRTHQAQSQFFFRNPQIARKLAIQSDLLSSPDKKLTPKEIAEKIQQAHNLSIDNHEPLSQEEVDKAMKYLQENQEHILFSLISSYVSPEKKPLFAKQLSVSLQNNPYFAKELACQHDLYDQRRNKLGRDLTTHEEAKIERAATQQTNQTKNLTRTELDKAMLRLSMITPTSTTILSNLMKHIKSDFINSNPVLTKQLADMFDMVRTAGFSHLSPPNMVVENNFLQIVHAKKHLQSDTPPSAEETTKALAYLSMLTPYVTENMLSAFLRSSMRESSIFSTVPKLPPRAQTVIYSGSSLSDVSDSSSIVPSASQSHAEYYTTQKKELDVLHKSLPQTEATAAFKELGDRLLDKYSNILLSIPQKAPEESEGVYRRPYMLLEFLKEIPNIAKISKKHLSGTNADKTDKIARKVAEIIHDIAYRLLNDEKNQVMTGTDEDKTFAESTLPPQVRTNSIFDFIISDAILITSKNIHATTDPIKKEMRALLSEITEVHGDENNMAINGFLEFIQFLCKSLDGQHRDVGNVMKKMFIYDESPEAIKEYYKKHEAAVKPVWDKFIEQKMQLLPHEVRRKKLSQHRNFRDLGLEDSELNLRQIGESRIDSSLSDMTISRASSSVLTASQTLNPVTLVAPTQEEMDQAVKEKAEITTAREMGEFFSALSKTTQKTSETQDLSKETLEYNLKVDNIRYLCAETLSRFPQDLSKQSKGLLNYLTDDHDRKKKSMKKNSPALQILSDIFKNITIPTVLFETHIAKHIQEFGTVAKYKEAARKLFREANSIVLEEEVKASGLV